MTFHLPSYKPRRAKVAARDAGASDMHSHAGAWERVKINLGMSDKCRNKWGQCKLFLVHLVTRLLPRNQMKS